MSARSMQRQRGAATLATVMILFIIIAMMAAYASRNMVFEQRIAGNFYRSGVGMQAAEAGAEWALAMLNGTNINANCQPGAGAAGTFRERYLTFGANRSITVKPGIGPSIRAAAGCELSANNSWTCQCPSSGSPFTRPAAGAATGLQPLFDVSLQGQAGLVPAATVAAPLKNGVVRVLVNACTGLPAATSWNANSTLSQACTANIALGAGASIGKGEVSVDLALVSALKMPPASPLVALGNVDAGAAALGLHNAAPAAHGLLLQAGGALTGTLGNSGSLPGSLVSEALAVDDAGLTILTPAQFFQRYLGMPASTYSTQPAIRTVPIGGGCASDCGQVLAARIAAGERLIWVNEPADFAVNVTLGTPADPVVIVINGPVRVTGPLQINGALYVNGDMRWDNSSGLAAAVRGTLLVAGSFTAIGSVNLFYDGQIIDIVNNQRGSFVRVPGSWWDQAR